MPQTLKFVLGSIENIGGKRKKCWLPAFSPFLTMFSYACFPRGFKNRDCVGVKQSLTIQGLDMCRFIKLEKIVHPKVYTI